MVLLSALTTVVISVVLGLSTETSVLDKTVGLKKTLGEKIALNHTSPFKELFLWVKALSSLKVPRGRKRMESALIEELGRSGSQCKRCYLPAVQLWGVN